MGKVEVTRVVIDTNVVVSGLLFRGTPGKLISLWKSGRIRPLATKEMIEECLRVLAYPKFELSEEEINYLLYQEIMPYFEFVTTKPGPVIVKEDPSDDMFIRCAVAGKASMIISGDHHLLALKSHGKVKILTPSQFLNQFQQTS
jgi:putative PIN family toxin of toxin-antitoxin system